MFLGVRHHLVTAQADIFFLPAFPLVLYGMSRHESGRYIHRVIFVEFLDYFKHLHFCLEVKAVTAFGLACGDSEAHHFIEKALCLIVKLSKGRFSGLSHRVHDTAACSQNVQISGAFELEGNLILPVSSENHVGMAVDQSRRCQLPLRVENHVGFCRGARQFAAVRYGLYDSIFYEDSRVFKFKVFSLRFSPVTETACRSLQQPYIFYQ